MSYTIGIDLGINNVGWAILDNEKNQIEKSGVRLFNASDDASKRRGFRNTRRGKKRKDNRVNDVLKLFDEIGFPGHLIQDSKLIEKRWLGIQRKIEKQDIVNIVCYFMKHRGYIPFGDEEVNFVELNGLLPCQFYYEMYLEKGKYHGSDYPTVRIEENEKELNSLFSEQSKYYNELINIKDEIFKIFKRKRAFWEGPGSINSLTPYGRFKTDEDVLEYNKNKEENSGFEKYIFEDLIGKCKIAINEKCVPKVNYYAEVFNLLNDFINVNIKNIEGLSEQDNYVNIKNTYKFSEIALNKIINYCKENTSVKIESLLKKLFGLKFEDIEGYRVNKSRKPEFSTMQCYRSIKKILIDEKLSTEWLDDYTIYNRVIYNMAIAPGRVECLKMISSDSIISERYKFNELELNVLGTIYLKLKKAGSFKYHSLSEKVLVKAINDMLSNQMNFMQVRKKFDYDKEMREYFASNYTTSIDGMVHISSKYVDDIIASPQVKKSLRQAIKVINAIISEKKSLPEVIAIESTKDMNGNDLRKEIEKDQKIRETIRKNARDLIISYFGEEKLNEKNIDKVMLYNEINGECPYCGKVKIKLEDVIDNRIEVEHILPLSKSCDDSFDNKTIVCTNCNHTKGNKTPYEFLNAKQDYDSFKERIKSLKNMAESKKDRLLFEGSIDKYKTRFFNRNLRDTAYATTELINQINLFNYYLESTSNQEKILTLSTPGQLTHKIRKNLELEKDRDDGKYHHAVDASIVAGIANTDIGKLLINSQNNPKFFINNKERIFIKIPNLLENFSLGSFINDLQNIKSDENVKISRQVIKNPQKELANSNTYKFIKKDDDDFYKIEQINNIYLIDLKSDRALLDILFDEENNTKTLLCYDNDKELFYRLKEIYEKYKDEKGSPFINYILDRDGLEKGTDVLSNIEKLGIKVSSKENSPIVKKLRYYSKISTPFLLEKKNFKKKDKTYIGFDSMKQTCTEVYADVENNKFIFLPVYSISMNLKNKTINKDEKYYNLLHTKYIGDKKVKFISTLYNGMYLVVEKRNGNVICGEYQGFDKNSNRIRFINGESFVTSDISLTVYDVDLLGNRKFRLTETLK